VSRLAIVTVVLDDAAGLRATAESLAAQSCRDFEWHVLDGGSTDGTLQVVAEFIHLIDDFRSEPDGGPYAAMNDGLDRAAADYLWFLNAGDRAADPGTVAALIGALAAEPDFLYGGSWEDDGARPLAKPARSHRRAWAGMFTHHQAMIYRRAVLAGLRYRTDLPIGADYALTLEVLARSRRIVRLDRPLCRFRPGGLSMRRAAEGRRDQRRIRQELLGWPAPLAAAYALLQAGVFTLRRRVPRLYAALRFRRGA